MFRAKILVFLSLILVPLSGYAGITGKISGTVTDKATKEPLIGVNVTVEGTTLGAATDAEGKFFIINVPAGRHNLITSVIGYKRVRIDGLNVIADFTVQQDFSLEQSAVEAEAVVITAERPIIQRDQTASTKVVTAEEVQNLPTRGYADVVELQAGVVPYEQQDQDTGEYFRAISIRGGRRNETAFYVDGFSQQDPLTGVSTTSIDNNAIDQITVISGGFNAEYGRIMSGVVNVITKGGSRNYHGSIEAVTDGLAGSWINTPIYDYRVYDASFSGPLIPGKDKVTFYVSSEIRDQGDRTPRATAGGKLPHNSLSGGTYHGKLNINPTHNLRFEVGSMNSFDKYEEYYHSYRYDLSHAPRTEDMNSSVYARMVHAIKPSTFYDFSINYFYTQRYRGDGKAFKEIWKYGRPEGNPRYDDLALFYYGDSVNTAKDEGHVWDDLLHRESSYYGTNFNITSQVGLHNQLKAGFEYQRHTLRLYHHLFPRNAYLEPNGAVFSGAFKDLDVYGYDNVGNKISSGDNGPKHPGTFAAYFQDKIEFENLVINAGLRYDYIDPATRSLQNASRPLEAGASNSALDPQDLAASKVRQKISPRIGIGFPVSLTTLLHFNYGKFYQQPNLQDLYVNYNYLEYKVKSGGYFFGFGNPNLKPETTTAYEAGLTQAVSDNIRFDVTAYYKRVLDLVEIVNQPSFPSNFATFRNRDFGVIKGVDLSIYLRQTKNLSGNVAYSLSFANGTGSTSWTHRQIAWTADNPPKLSAPLDFDQRHKLNINIDYRIPRDAGPSLGNFKPFQKTGLNILFTGGSGTPYTPFEVYNEVTLAAVPQATPAGAINSRYGPWTWRLDAKVNRVVTAGAVDFNFYVWILNLFDRDNMLQYYTSTGLANSTSWLVTEGGKKYVERFGEKGQQAFLLKERNPLFYGVPRMVRFGLLIEF